MADVNINMVEFAKGLDDPVASAMIEQFAIESDVLARGITFKAADKGMNVFDRETSEPVVAFRALNAEPDINHGSEEQFQDICAPISGLIEFDRIKLKRYGERKRMTYMKGQMKKGARVWTDTFINGDNATDPKEWSGLKVRLVADATGSVDGSVDDSRLIANSVASGGAALSLANLDLAIRMVANPTHILMPRGLHVKLIGAMRNINVSGHVLHYEQEGGKQVLYYGNLPILVGYEVSKGSSFLPFDEVAYGGGSAVTASVYVVSFREDGVSGIQTSEPEFIPVDTDKGVFQRDLFEWDSGITIEDFYAAIRLSSVTNAAIVA